MLSYDVVDVFTDRPFAGNPLAVVHGAEGLTDRQLLAIAREFNLSETTFPAEAAAAGDGYAVRIFTPGGEIPFAGHPTLGTAWVLQQHGRLRPGTAVQRCGAGLLPVTVDEHGAQVAGGAPAPGTDLDGAALTAAVGLDPADLDPELSAGVAGAGIPFAFLPVRPDAVARAVSPHPAALAAVTGDVTGLAVFAFDRPDWRAHLRMFAPAVGVPEDPATGSAAVALGVFLTARGVLGADGQTGFTVAQGAEMGRPSTLGVLVRAAAGSAVSTQVYGSVAAVARGELLTLPE